MLVPKPRHWRAGWICQPAELILATDQGQCVYNHEDKLCTWVGFEFDYRSSVKGSKLQCTSHSSEPTNQGNPDGIQKKDLTADQFEIELPEKSGHLFTPQYFVFNPKYPAEGDLLIETQCASSGKPVFSHKFRIHLPVIPRPYGNVPRVYSRLPSAPLFHASARGFGLAPALPRFSPLHTHFSPHHTHFCLQA